MLTAGIVVFDVLIANGDRHAGNLSRDPGYTPPRVSVFDHGHALLGTNPPTGLERIELATDRLGCIDDDAAIATDSVLIAEEIDCTMLEQWCERAQELPAYVFHDICRDVARTPELGLTVATADQLADWLARRAARIGDLICQNQDELPNVEWSLWGPGGQPS